MCGTRGPHDDAAAPRRDHQHQLDLSASESPEFIGRVINALCQDPNLMARTGQVLVAAAVTKEFGVLDIDGSSPPALTLEDL